MIAALHGKIFTLTNETLVLEVQGVFYEAYCSLNTLSELAMKQGQEVFLHSYLHVREDIMQLFGFTQAQEKTLFLSLLKVSGIGPKSALHILSGASCAQISNWIEAGDAKALAMLPKLGKKTAEQLVLTLRGKLILEPMDKASGGAVLKRANGEVVSALVNLGFRLPEVEKVVSGFAPDIPIEEGIRQGLRELSSL